MQQDFFLLAQRILHKVVLSIVHVLNALIIVIEIKKKSRRFPIYGTVKKGTVSQIISSKYKM